MRMRRPLGRRKLLRWKRLKRKMSGSGYCWRITIFADWTLSVFRFSVIRSREQTHRNCTSLQVSGVAEGYWSYVPTIGLRWNIENLRELHSVSNAFLSETSFLERVNFRVLALYV